MFNLQVRSDLGFILKIKFIPFCIIHSKVRGAGLSSPSVVVEKKNNRTVK